MTTNTTGKEDNTTIGRDRVEGAAIDEVVARGGRSRALSTLHDHIAVPYEKLPLFFIRGMTSFLVRGHRVLNSEENSIFYIRLCAF